MAELKTIDELNIKQRMFIKEYLKLKSGTQAYMKVYEMDDELVAAAAASRLLKKVNIEDMMEEAGLSNEKLMQVHREGLEANRVVGAMKGSTATAADGDFIEVPDYAVRHKYLETAYKLKHILVERQEVSGPDGEPIQYKIITGTGYIPTGVVIDATPEGSDTAGQPPVQSLSVAQESTQDDDSDIRTSETVISS